MEKKKKKKKKKKKNRKNWNHKKMYKLQWYESYLTINKKLIGNLIQNVRTLLYTSIVDVAYVRIT